MLILSRYRDDSCVVVGPDGKTVLGTVKVVDVRGNKVRLGFEFPTDHGVHREEVWASIQKNGLTRQAAVEAVKKDKP